MARRNRQQQEQVQKDDNMVLGVRTSTTPTDVVINVYEPNRNYSSSGSLKNYDIDQILQRKQDNIYKIYELMSFYVDADSIFSGAIKRILVPFSSSKWYLQGKNEAAKRKYEQWFNDIKLNDLIKGLFYDLYLYGQVFLYDRGSWIDILPPHKIQIMDMGVNGEPVLAFKIEEFATRGYAAIDEKFINTLLKKYEGYPEEIQEGIKKRQQWVQLNPANTYAIQGQKSLWEKYAMPFGVSALKAFAKKQLISEYENALLNLMVKSFLHVKVGDSNHYPKPSVAELSNIGNIFKDAINGFPLAVTTWNIDAEWVRLNDSNFDISKNKYVEVNTEILESCGISSLIVSGQGDSSSSYAQAQVNVNVLVERIEQAQRDVIDFINTIMRKRAAEWRVSDTRIPEFHFEETSLRDDTAFRKEVLSLFQNGLLGYRSTLERLGYDYEQEKSRKQDENESADRNVFVVPPSFYIQTPDSDAGRPTTPDNERVSDPNDSKSGAAPKPSGS